jgi:hypothetical protein
MGERVYGLFQKTENLLISPSKAYYYSQIRQV